ncbi:MAG: hypothetical protein QNJ98_04205 [Planctomycetota bacterium]|nr:hypothetical protein [Planctomycetota bacterium]
MRIQNAYVHYRNRRSGYPGALVSGRYRSKPVTSWMYFRTLLRYHDLNPVKAGLSRQPWAYAYGSAIRYYGGRPPLWLDADAVVRHLGGEPDGRTFPAEKYRKACASPLLASEVELIERRLSHPHEAEDQLDQLMNAPPPYLARWMAGKIRRAGGKSPWSPIASVAAVLSAVGSAHGQAALGQDTASFDRASRDVRIASVGLLRSLACLGVDECAHRVGVHRSTAARLAREHERRMRVDGEYFERVGEMIRGALDATFPVFDGETT